MEGASVSRQERRRLERERQRNARPPSEICRADDEAFYVNDDLEGLKRDVGAVRDLCAACGSLAAEKKLLHCRACGFDRYCDRDCQRAAWARHKLVCRVMAADKAVSAGFTGFRLGEQLAGLDQTLAWLGSGKPAEVAKVRSKLTGGTQLPGDGGASIRLLTLHIFRPFISTSLHVFPM